MTEPLSIEEMTNVISRLVDLTHEGKVKWVVAKDNNYLFRAAAKDFLYVISSRDKDDFAPYVFYIYRRAGEADASGKIPLRLVQQEETDRDYTPVNEPMDILYTLVKRKLFKLDEVANDIFDSLDSLE